MLMIGLRDTALVLAAAVVAAAAPINIHQSAFKAAANGYPAGWSVWSARGEIAPRTFIDTVQDQTEPGSLAISGNSNPAAYGGWEYLVRGIAPAHWYRFVAFYRTTGIQDESQQVVVRLDWKAADGKVASRPDYPYAVTPDGAGTRLSLDLPAPAKADSLKIELYLANAPQATIWWDDISLEEIPDPGPRPVTVA